MGKNVKKKDWHSKVSFRPHFDLWKTFNKAKHIVKSEHVERHNFLPFINFVIESYKFQRRLNSDNEITTRKDGLKQREINYSSHSDAYIFSRYNEILSEKYEKFLADNSLDCVIAYRSIKKTVVNFKTQKTIEVGKSNIDFAAEAFTEIKNKENCYCLGIDIKGFFDNLNHEQLKENLQNILGVDKLPKDWLLIFNVLTDFHFIMLKDILKERNNKKMKNELTEDDIELFKKTCTAKTLRKIIAEKKHIIKSNKNYINGSSTSKGIPQGTNLSGTLANIYMVVFDLKLQNYVKENNGYYRRYSDDILFIVNSKEQLEEIISLVKQIIKEMKLEISSEKTLCCKFNKVGCLSIPCSLRNEPHKENSFQYLGFTYDGKSVRLRNGTLGNFWTKAKKHIKDIVIGNALNKKKVPLPKIYGLYTHLHNKDAQYHGNFYGYVREAQKIFENEYGFENVKIKKQMANSWDEVQKYLKKLKDKYNISNEYL